MCWLGSAPCAHTPAALMKRFLVLHRDGRECERVMLTYRNAAGEPCLYHSSNAESITGTSVPCPRVKWAGRSPACHSPSVK